MSRYLQGQINTEHPNANQPNSNEPKFDQSILYLNDDCLYKILSYLNLFDLWKMGVACPQIYRITKRMFGRKSNLNVKDLLKDQKQLIPDREMKLIIKELGPTVKTFEISGIKEKHNHPSKWQQLIKYVLTYCTNLTSLIIRINIDEQFAQEIGDLLSCLKLEKLKVIGNIPMSDMSHLKDLHIISFNGEIKANFSTLKNLESFTLCSSVHIPNSLLSQVCDNNPGIKRLEIYNMTDVMLKTIIEKLPNLEKITVDHPHEIRDKSMLRISDLKLLNDFSGDFVPIVLLRELVLLDQLESLSYHWKEQDEMKLISKLTKLKYLRGVNFSDNDLNTLKSKRTLERVDFDYSKKLTNNGVLKFVLGAKNLKHLRLCGCDGCNTNLLHMLSSNIKSGNIKNKLTIVCDFLRKGQELNFPLLNVIVDY